MNALSIGTATQSFEVEYEAFMQHREQLQELFLASRFEMIEEAWRESGTELELDRWLLKSPGLHRRSNGEHFWAHAQPYRLFGDSGLWRVLFASGSGGDGRTNFVEAFNRLLEGKRMRTRLGDNGVQMYFQDVAHYRPRR